MSKLAFIHNTSYYELVMEYREENLLWPTHLAPALMIQVYLKHENKDPSEAHVNIRCPKFVCGFHVSSIPNIINNLKGCAFGVKGDLIGYLSRFCTLYSHQNYHR